MKIYEIIKKRITKPIKNWLMRNIQKWKVIKNKIHLLNSYGSIAFSQEGEDRILFSLFSLLDKPSGFYVDIGAHHPQRFSNTYHFYLAGWQGINIDANQESINLFQKYRPRDVNLAIGIDEVEAKKTFYIFNEPALNTFDAKIAEEVAEDPHYSVVEVKTVNVAPLSKILDQYLPEGQQIDFMTIDVEGKDFSVLKSNDWLKYRPFCLLVEIYSGKFRKEGFTFEEILNSEVAEYLKSINYYPFSKTLNTIFFIHR